jgi:hypothetical protein
MTFLWCLNTCSGNSHDSTWYGGVKNEKTVWRKRILVTQYIYVYTAMYWVYQCIYLVFAKARPPKFCHAFWLLSIDYKCTDTSPKHSTLYFGAESEKKYVQIMNICNTWLYQYWYILLKRNSDHHILDISHFNKVYTGIYLYALGIYWYMLVNTTVY